MEFHRVQALASAVMISAAALGLVCACSDSNAVDSPDTAIVSPPPPSAGHVLIYHDSLAAVLLVNVGLGGADSPPSTAKTVLRRWTGSQWVLQDSSGPPIRNLGGVAYDIARNVVVMHGGSYSLDLVYGETWEWHPRRGWSNRGVAGPGIRDHVEMAFDAARNRVVLHGGQVSLDSFPGDTWTWDGINWQSVATSGPGKRLHHTMAFDPTSQYVMLFGGFKPSVGDFGDTWSWSGTAWEPAAGSIAPRTHARLGFTSQGLILVGGFPSEAASTIMRLENGTWISASQTPNPGPRYLTAMAYDPIREVTVLFGGGDPASETIYDDTWEYDASIGWRRVESE